MAVMLMAACGHEPETTPMPVPVANPPTSYPMARISQDIASRLTVADVTEPREDGLSLQVRDYMLFVKGTIDEDSYDEVSRVLANHPDLRVMVFTHLPGSADDETNLALGRMLRDRGMMTYLPSAGLIASGGVDLFLAGAYRVVESGAKVGVHSWADISGLNGATLPRDDPEHGLFLDYYRYMGIDEAFYWFTLNAAPPEGIHWMTATEMRTYGIYTEWVTP